MKLKSTKFITMSDCSLYENANSYNIKKDFVYSSFLKAYIEKSLLTDYTIDILIYSEFEVRYNDDEFENLKEKILNSLE